MQEQTQIPCGNDKKESEGKMREAFVPFGYAQGLRGWRRRTSNGKDNCRSLRDDNQKRPKQKQIPPG